jgi:hypothetical protein
MEFMAKGIKTGGRNRGTPNKLTADVKAMILVALSKAGGVKYLVKQAAENPTAFMSLVGKVLPLQVTGKGGGPLQYQNIDAPMKETRDEWLTRQMGTASGSGEGTPAQTIGLTKPR